MRFKNGYSLSSLLLCYLFMQLYVQSRFTVVFYYQSTFYIYLNQSLMKSQQKNKSGLVKKSMNLTTHIAQGVKSHIKKSSWKSKTTKMAKTLTGKTITQKQNMMTEDDIQKLFKNHSKQKQIALVPTKVSTEVCESFPILDYRDFVRTVKFLQVQDQTDKFLSGLPQTQFDQRDLDALLLNSEIDDLTTLFKKNYSVGKIIGEGAYATVRVAIYKPTQRKIALKIYQKAKIKQIQRKKSVRRQIKILQMLDHPNIVKIYDVVQTNNHLNIAMEYLPGLSLGTYLKAQPNGRIPEKTCKRIFKSLARALSYMHELHIAHRDIKLQNIILDEDISPKLIDFGFSTCIEPHQKMKIFCGTPSYMAPEVVQRKQYRGQTADVWALGVLLFVSLTGIFPFKGSTDEQLFKKISQSDYPKGELLFSRSVSQLISKMLKVNPEQRIKASQVLNHSWFTEGKNDSSKKRNVETSHEGRKRVYTINTHFQNQIKVKNKKGKHDENEKLQRTDKKILHLAQTCKQNLNLQIRMALKSPTNKQISSFRKRKQDKQKQKQKQNVKFSLKNEKNNKGGLIKQTYMKQNIKQRQKENEMAKKKEKLLKTQPKLIQFLRMELKKRHNDGSKSKSNTHRN